MEYKMEDLVPIVMELAEKYTSKESSSITYETAQMLMEGVIYCLDQVTDNTADALVTNKEDIQLLYKEGYHRIINKTEEANRIYNQLLENFDHYGCNNYKNTILKDLPNFFLYYSPKFDPQNHKVELDYPCLQTSKQTGINLILEYLKRIRIEDYFLSSFEKSTIIHLLQQTTDDYTNFYFENIPHLVLFHAIGCQLAGKSPNSLLLDLSDCQRIEEHLKTKTPEEIQKTIIQTIHEIMKDLKLETIEPYFTSTTPNYTSILKNAIQYNTIPILFNCNS